MASGPEGGDRRTAHAHRGALLFTGIVGVALASVLSATLTVGVGRVGSNAPAALAEDAAAPPVVPTPLPEALHSRWYTQTSDPTIDIGETASITLQFRNVGQTAWVRGSAAEIRLGMTGPDPLPYEMRAGWAYPDRPAVQTESIVDPGMLATFSFQVKGVAPGTFRLGLRPVVDGVKWLEDDDVHVDITVVPKGPR